MDWNPIISAIVGAVLMYVGQIAVARFSKSRRERDASLASDYIKLIDMTSDQLERRINLIDKLDTRLGETDSKLRKQEKENETLREHRQERDEKIRALETNVESMRKQIEKDSRETDQLTRKMTDLEKQVADGNKKLSNYKQAVELLLTVLRENDMTVPAEVELLLGDSIHGLKWPKK